MKKSVIFIALVAGLFAANPLKSSAQFIVRVRPERPAVVVARPPAPAPGYVWVEEEWNWSPREHRYVAVPGYWLAPKRGREWVPGHWIDVNGGAEWIRGHWARRY